MVAEAIRYALSHWDGIYSFSDDGRVALGANTVERAFDCSPLTARTRSAGFNDGGDNWTVIASYIETVKLNRADPQACLTNTLTRLVTAPY